jgi:hypothetical protein
MNRLHSHLPLHNCHTLAALALLLLSPVGTTLRADDAAASATSPTRDVTYINGFETSEEQTLPDGAAKGNVSIDTTEAHGGQTSLKIVRADRAQEVYWRSPSFDVKAGGIYRFSCWMKFAQVIMPDPSYSPEAHVEFLNPASAVVGDVAFADSWKLPSLAGSTGYGTLNHDWMYHEKLITAPAGATMARIFFTFIKTTGTTWLDDVRVTYEPHAVIPGQVNATGFLMLWPARAGEKGSLFKAGGSFFNPGEPIDWFVQAPPLDDAAKPSVVQWKIHDSLDRPLLSGSSDVPAGATLPKITLPNLDAQKARWLRCDWTWQQDGKTLASRLTSILVLPPVNPYPHDRFGNFFDRSVKNIAVRLGTSVSRTDVFWLEHEQPTPDSPVDFNYHVEEVKQASQMGIQPLVLWGWSGPKWADLYPNELHSVWEGWPSRPDALNKAVIETVTELKDYVKFWQLGNEIGYSNPQRRHDYITDAKAFYDGVKAADPNARVVLGSQGGALSDVRLAAKEGILNYCDIYDCHYQQPTALREIRSFLDQAAPGRHIPIWETECGMFYAAPDNFYASEFIRIMATNVGEGVDLSIWCGLGGGSGGNERGASPPNNTQSSCLASTLMPGQMCASHVLCTEFFGNSKSVKPLDTGLAHGYLLRHDNTWTAILWAEGLEPLPVVLRGVGGHVKVADWTARQAELDTQAGALPLVLSDRPWLIQWTADQAPEVALDLNPPLTVKSEHVGMLFKGAQNPLTVTLPAKAAEEDISFDAGPGVTVTPATLHLKPGEAQTVTVDIPADDDSDRLTLDTRSPGAWLDWEYRLQPALTGEIALEPRSNRLDTPANHQAAWLVTLQNRTSAPVSATVDAASMATLQARPDTLQTAVTVPAHDEKIVRMPLSIQPDYSCKYSATAKVAFSTGETESLSRDSGFLGVTHVTTPIEIDGNLEDWKDIEPAHLDKAEDFWHLFHDKTPWGGKPYLSALLYFAWDEKYIYFAANVEDIIHFNDTPNAIFIGDSVEFALQPVVDGQDQAVTKFLFALTRGKVGKLAFCRGHALDLSVIDADVVRGEKDKRTYYEARIPWTCLGPGFTPEVGAHLKTAVMLNDNNGHGSKESLMSGRKAVMSWFGTLFSPSLGEKLFTDMTLTK